MPFKLRAVALPVGIAEVERRLVPMLAPDVGKRITRLVRTSARDDGEAEFAYGLAGERLDAGLSRLFGLSRSAIAELAEEGGVLIDGAPAGKSARLKAGAWLEVTLPGPDQPLELVAEPSGLLTMTE